MKHLRNIAVLSVALSLSFAFAGCNSDKNVEQLVSQAESAVATPTPEPCYPEQAVITNGDIVFKLVADNYYTVDNLRKAYIMLTYNYTPSDVQIAVEEWSSSDESVATVTDKGKLEPVGFGECEITLHISDGLTEGTTTSINVKVEDGINIIDDRELPTYSTLCTDIKSDYGDDVDVYDTDLFYFGDDDFLAIYTSDSEYFNEERIDIALGNLYEEDYIVCKTSDCDIIICDGLYSLYSDQYCLTYGYTGTNLGFDHMREVIESYGLPFPDEELLSSIS